MATPYEEALEIVQTARWGESHGLRIVQVLLRDRTVGDLDAKELRLLATGYSWAAKPSDAFEASCLALELGPKSPDALDDHWGFARNLFSGDPLGLEWLLAGYAGDGFGPRPFWLMRLAEVYLDLAYWDPSNEDDVWWDGRPLTKPRFLPEAIEALEEAVIREPGLLAGPHPYDGHVDWNDRFEKLGSSDDVAHLKRPNSGS